MRTLMAVGVVLLCPYWVQAEPVKPLRALLIVGGCCHDYDAQQKILADGISSRANVAFTIVHERNSGTYAKIPIYDQENYAKGFDVVIHDECFADVKEVEWLEKVLKPHKAGVPAVVLHCAMHCYRAPTDEWFKFIGITSPGHGAHYPFEVKNMKSDHPIMKPFGDKWDCPKDELYFCNKVWETATPLAEAFSKDRNAMQTCVWTNLYGNTRVFGTTIGHYNETVVSEQYLSLVTRGLLWATGKLNDDGTPAEGYGK